MNLLVGIDFSPSDREVRLGVIVGSTAVFLLYVAVTWFTSDGRLSPVDFLPGILLILPIVIVLWDVYRGDDGESESAAQ